MSIREIKNSIIIENDYFKVEFSKKDTMTLSAVDGDGKSIMGVTEGFYR